jgi:hypothetical protein
LGEKLKKALIISAAAIVLILITIGLGYLLGRRSTRDEVAEYQERVADLEERNRLAIESARAAAREVQDLEIELLKANGETRRAEDVAEQYKDLSLLQYGIIQAFETGDRELGDHALGARDAVGRAEAIVDEILQEIEASKD